MSKALSLREALGRRDVPRAASSEPSSFPTRYRLRATGEVVRPVDVARLMTEHGVSLRRAHGFLQSLVQGDVVAVQMVAPRVEELVTRFAELAVEALELRLPEVSTKAVRARLNLSQSEFALRFGFELDTVQNWDQGRNQPDGAAKILLAIIDRDPAIVDAVLSGQRSPGQTS